MTKADLAERINSKLGFSKKESIDLIESVLSIMKDTLEDGEKIKIAGFGTFEVRQKRERLGRNPVSGEPITIDARRVLNFKPSILLRQAVNK